jgi:predicted DNA-binding transcriptional regulator AlpA
MAESRADQVSFDWATEPTAASPAARPPAARKVSASRRKVDKAAASIPAPKTKPAKASEPTLPPDNELWDVHAAARFLKRSVSWVYHKAEDGTLPVRRLGGWGLRFIPGELRAWVHRDGASSQGPR